MKKNYLILVLMLILQACSHEDKDKNQIINIEKKSLANTLFYTGTIQPLKTLVITSPADGVVVEMPFQYGEQVKAGQLLFKLSSAKFLADYKAALMQYIKAKNDFNSNQTQLSESDFLHKNLLISDDDFKMKQSNFYAAQLALVQAKDALEVLLHQLDIKNVNLYNLSIADVDKITQALHLEENSENIRLLAPSDGIVLAPHKSLEEIKKTLKGDAVKQGDVLAVIGDMSGISVHIKVNELTINQLKAGQKVKVTGIAFPDEALEGKVKQVDRQGEAASGGLPTFPVEIHVSKLSAAQQKIIHAGMSAKLEINIDEPTQIMIPITALIEKNGESFVNVVDKKSGKNIQVAVKTGKTNLNSIAITAGLNLGDKLVVPN